MWNASPHLGFEFDLVHVYANKYKHKFVSDKIYNNLSLKR